MCNNLKNKSKYFTKVFLQILTGENNTKRYNNENKLYILHNNTDCEFISTINSNCFFVEVLLINI